MSEIKKLGRCPYCNGDNYTRDLSEIVNDYCVFDCWCNNCDERFTEYFVLDEVKYDKEDEEFFVCSTLGDNEKETLIKALNLLVESESDKNNYSEIFGKLKGELKPSN